MANTTTFDGSFIHVLFDGATDWDLNTDIAKFLPEAVQGIFVRSITVFGDGTDDEITIRNTLNADTLSVIIIKDIFTSKYARSKYSFGEGKWMLPAIDATEVTANVEMIIDVQA